MIRGGSLLLLCCFFRLLLAADATSAKALAVVQQLRQPRHCVMQLEVLSGSGGLQGRTTHEEPLECSVAFAATERASDVVLRFASALSGLALKLGRRLRPGLEPQRDLLETELVVAMPDGHLSIEYNSVLEEMKLKFLAWRDLPSSKPERLKSLRHAKPTSVIAELLVEGLHAEPGRPRLRIFGTVTLQSLQLMGVRIRRLLRSPMNRGQVSVSLDTAGDDYSQSHADFVAFRFFDVSPLRRLCKKTREMSF